MMEAYLSEKLQDEAVLAGLELSAVSERRSLGLHPDQSICPGCAAGAHEDHTCIAAGFRCSCPCH